VLASIPNGSNHQPVLRRGLFGHFWPRSCSTPEMS